MLTPSDIRRHLVGSAFMAGGGFGVFLVVLLMNSERPPPQKEKATAAVEFKVEPKKPKPKKRQEQRKPKPRPQRKSAAAPKTPNLSAAISEASFGLAGLDVGDVGASFQKDLVGDFSKKGAMTADALDTPPKPARRVSARYPDQAQKRGVEGYVNFNIEVLEDGRVGRIQILESTPPGVFDEAARAAMSQWEFQPGLYESQPQTAWVKQRITFKLNKG